MCKETAIRGIPQSSRGLGFIFLIMVKLIQPDSFVHGGMCLITSAFGVSGWCYNTARQALNARAVLVTLQNIFDCFGDAELSPG